MARAAVIVAALTLPCVAGLVMIPSSAHRVGSHPAFIQSRFSAPTMGPFARIRERFRRKGTEEELQSAEPAVEPEPTLPPPVVMTKESEDAPVMKLSSVDSVLVKLGMKTEDE